MKSALGRSQVIAEALMLCLGEPSISLTVINRSCCRRARRFSVWRLTQAAASRFPDNHGELTLEMIGAVRAAFGEGGLERLLHERTRRQIRDYTNSLMLPFRS